VVVVGDDDEMIITKDYDMEEYPDKSNIERLASNNK